MWTLFLLGNNLEQQEKVHEELEKTFENSETIAMANELSELKYLDRVIKETLRLYPSVPFISRSLDEDIKIGMACCYFTYQISSKIQNYLYLLLTFPATLEYH